ncbi:MAG: GNAT family N-acetyltransferase, partial [Methanosarcinaceae archaeon]|nr:GNAT family N-acetyltransferase [Methanosarcinaceae archaeon]
ESNQYSFFHSYEWIKVLRESYGYKPYFFILKNKREFSALLPFMEVNSRYSGRRGVSLPFSDYCNPIIREEISAQRLLERTIGFGKTSNWKFLDMHGGEIFFQGKKSSREYYGHSLKLMAEPNKILKHFRDSNRRNIKKAVTSGVEIHRSNSLHSMRDFYRLHCLTRKRHRLPVQPFHFFQKIHEHIISKKSGFIIKALYDDKIVGGAIFFHFGNKAMFKFGASDLRYQHLRMNNLIMWETIKWYATNGYESFCFGRTDIENLGLRQFKQGWGTKEYRIKYFKYDLNADALIKDNTNNIGKTLHLVFSKMPIPISRILGAFLYRHFG